LVANELTLGWNGVWFWDNHLHGVAFVVEHPAVRRGCAGRRRPLPQARPQLLQGADARPMPGQPDVQKPQEVGRPPLGLLLPLWLLRKLLK